jgi:hypothetical protein
MPNPKYADFVNEQNSPEAQKKQQYTGWVSSDGQSGRAVDTQHNITQLAQKPQESEFVSRPTGEQQLAANPQIQQQFNIDDMPKRQFDIGLMAIENEYIQQTNLAKQTTTDTAQLDTLYQNAKMKHDMQVQELTGKLQRTKMMYKKYNTDNTLSPENKTLAKMTFNDADPVYKVPPAPMKPQKPIFSPQKQQWAIGKLTPFKGVINRQDAISQLQQLGIDIDSAPIVNEYIQKNFEDENEEEKQVPKRGGLFDSLVDYFNKAQNNQVSDVNPAPTSDNNQVQQEGSIQPIYAKNKQTGKRIVSNDGGKTWQVTK